MDNSSKAAVSAAIAGGYLLGRNRKAKLAFALATYLAGRRFSLSATQLAHEGLRQLKEHPDLADLREQVRSELLTARSAASGSLDRRFASMASALRERSAGGQGAEDMEDEDMEDEDMEGGEDEDALEDMGEERVSEGTPADSGKEPEEDDEDEDEPEPAPRHRATHPHGRARPESSARRAAGSDHGRGMRSAGVARPARRSMPGEAAAKKEPAKKSAPTGKKAAQKRAPGKETAAGRSPSRSNQRGR